MILKFGLLLTRAECNDDICYWKKHREMHVIDKVREPAILLIKWLRPKGLKVCSYVEKYAELKNQTLKKLGGTQKCYAQRNTPGVGNFSNLHWNGVPYTTESNFTYLASQEKICIGAKLFLETP